jgi:myo-inositol-1-phosphate synthase
VIGTANGIVDLLVLFLD